MKSAWALRILGAAAILLASGCEFWDGLVGEKSVAKARLAVFAQDAWTGKAMMEGHCRDAAGRLEFDFGNAGFFENRENPTGEFDLTCTSPHYRPARIRIKVSRIGASDTLRFARNGGADWYTDDSLSVRLPEFPETLRFPAHLEWRAQPADANGAFRYEWTFRSATRLNWVPVNGIHQEKHLKPDFMAEATSGYGVGAGEDTVCMAVFSRLSGPEGEYLVGKECRPFSWVRNKLPKVEIDPDSNVTTYKVGCGPNPVRPRILASDSDSDGECRTLRLFAPDTLSSLGPLNMTLACKPSQTISLPLRLPADPAESKNGKGQFPTILYAEVTDDNGEKSLDTLEFFTYPNVSPTAKSKFRANRNVYFPEDSVWFSLEGHDEDGPIEKLTFYWGGKDFDFGQVDMEPISDAQGVAKEDSFKVFQQTGKATITSWALDNCGEKGIATEYEMEIRANTKPTILYENYHKVNIGGKLQHGFNLTIKDVDVANQLDSLKVYIHWGDGLSDTLLTRNGDRPMNDPRRHHYAGTYPNGTTFPILIEAVDAHQGKVQFDTLMAY